MGAEWTRYLDVTRIKIEVGTLHGRAPFSVCPALHGILVIKAYLSNAPDIAIADVLHALTLTKLPAPGESDYQSKR